MDAINRDWMKEMETEGCPHISYIKEVRTEDIRPAAGWAYHVLVVCLQKEYQVGGDRLQLRRRVVVDLEALKEEDQPGVILCKYLTTTVNSMDKKAFNQGGGRK